MRARLFLIFLLSTFPRLAAADFVWNSTLQQAYAAASELNFSESARLTASERKIHPSNQLVLFVESHVDFLRAFISESSVDLKLLKEHTAERITLLQKSEGTSPYRDYLLGEWYLQLSITRIKAEEYFGAAYDARKAFHYFEDNQEKYPSFLPNLRGLGFMHAVVGSIPTNYSWVAGVLGMSGSIEQGIAELRTLLQATERKPELVCFHDETTLILTFLEQNLGNEKSPEQARKRFSSISDIDRKPLVAFAKCTFHQSMAENDSIITVLERRKTNGEFPLYYLEFQQGSALLHNLNPSAAPSFEAYLRHFKGKSYRAAAWQRLAWTKLLAGDEAGYDACMKNCLSIPASNLITYEDRQAVNEAKSGIRPNPILLRSRLLFDGGYYNRALANLAGKPMTNFPTMHEQLEFTYRLARIFDKQNKQEQALRLYEETIKNGSAQPYYFAANAALLAGRLYENSNDTEKAKSYYNRVLEMRNHEYQNSIDQKAKAGLNRINDKEKKH